MKRITLELLIKQHPSNTYEQQYQRILKLIEDGKLKPVKASGVNGKKPALYREYWILEEKPDYSVWLDELKYSLHPAVFIDYYLSHPEIYVQERWAVKRLSDYLKEQEGNMCCPESVNERSFEIWGQEKFLKKGPGRKILKHCGLDIGFLNVYETTEPLAYYVHTREVPQNLLILENKDTFFSMRKHLMEFCEEPNRVSGEFNAAFREAGVACRQREILGVPIGTLIYGAGKGILKSFRDFEFCAEPYMRAKGNSIFYFGDLDYEGIGIFESFARSFEAHWEVIPFLPAYEAMLEKAGKAESLPEMKEQQNRNIENRFFSYFQAEQVQAMQKILKENRYIPQEILNRKDFA